MKKKSKQIIPNIFPTFDKRSLAAAGPTVWNSSALTALAVTRMARNTFKPIFSKNTSQLTFRAGTGCVWLLAPGRTEF